MREYLPDAARAAGDVRRGVPGGGSVRESIASIPEPAGRFRDVFFKNSYLLNEKKEAVKIVAGINYFYSQ